MRRPPDFFRAVVLPAVTAGVLVVAGCSSGSEPTAAGGGTATTPSAATVTVAAFNFTESQILAHVFADVLDDAGVPASVRTLTTREAVQPALWRGSVQIVPEYAASLTAYLLAQEAPGVVRTAPHDLHTTMAVLRSEAARHDLVVLDPSRAADQNAFAVTREFATSNHVRTLSELAMYGGRLVLGGPAECRTRPYCAPGLLRTYGIHFARFVALDPGGPLTKLALKTGHVQVGLVFTSDPGVRAYDLVVLADDKHLEDADVVVPVLREASATPAVTSALNRLTAALTTADLLDMNAAVDLRHEDPNAVARAYVDRLHVR